MLWAKKIDKVLSVIDEALSNYTHPYLSMSWGKDSMLLLHFVRQIKPQIPVIYVNSGYALPDSYLLRDLVVNDWNLNYYEINQEIDYIELCKAIGLPSERTKQVQKNAVQSIKKNVLDEFAINHGFDLCFWGIRIDESNGRAMMYRKNGYFIQTTEIHKCHPIALITLQELWYFYDYFNIPINQIYTKTKFLDKFQIRNTGWLSNDGAETGRVLWLKYYYPDYYNKLSKEFNYVRKYV